jgi:hypothetical protein
VHTYSATDTRLKAYGLLASLAVVLAWAANAVADCLGVGPAWLVSSPTVAASFYLLHRFTDATAWRWLSLHRAGIIATPVIDGVYGGHLVSSYDRSKEVPIKLTVSQRWTAISIEMEVTGRTTSRSESVAASLDPQGHSGAHLTYTYKNAVQPATADPDMRDHDGTADLDFDIATGTATGKYYNARGRKGTCVSPRSERSEKPVMQRLPIVPW